MSEEEVPEAEAEIGRMLRALPPIEPPAATIARTEKALARTRDRSRARWVGRLSLAAAGVLGAVGLTMLGRALDEESPAMADFGPARGTVSANTPASTTSEPSDSGEATLPQQGQARGRYLLGKDEGRDVAQQTAATARIVVDMPGYKDSTIVLDGEQTGAAGVVDGKLADGQFHIDLVTKGVKEDVTKGETKHDKTGEAGLELGLRAKLKEHRGEDYWRDSGVAPDTDADGIADVDDRCPNDGRDTGDEDGCPDAPETVAAVVGGKKEEGKESMNGLDAAGQTGFFKPSGDDDHEVPPAAATLAWSQDFETMKKPPVGDALVPMRGGFLADEPTFIPASGYFENTYLPGDPEVAWLRQAVARGLYRDGRRLALDELAQPVRQPFDAPRDQALALYVSAERTAVSEPTRMTLQVGLRGADQVPARRAPLAVALVVDLGSIGDDAERKNLWSIADAFVAERQAGDDMSVIVPGPNGAEVLAGDALTASEVTRFLAGAYERRGAGDLVGAVARGYLAARSSANGDQAESALGASVVVLATAGTPADTERLIGEAHAAALGNTQLAVIGAGPRADGEVLAKIAGAGQGRRWLVTRPEDARRAVSQELGAAGRAVARAVRLRLKLAPGVQLIEVLGSRPLAAPEADRVREAERAIDKKVAATTGIATDRGEDEDGIQIVIPAYMAGDDHVILLDVLVPGPGPVLEAHARFKDLVRLQNGEAHASLALENGNAVATPLTKNVIDNRIAFETAELLRVVAARIAAGDPAAAQAAMMRAAADAGGDDRALLAAYAEVLADAGWASSAELAEHLTRSLRLAAAIRGGAD